MKRKKKRKKNLQVVGTPRIESARHELLDRGYRCLSSGSFGLPSYSDIEAWANGSIVVYLIFDRKADGWDILLPVDHTNDIEATWRALDAEANRRILAPTAQP
jgi:hypothetical protein